jgi:hypothetical protein
MFYENSKNAAFEKREGEVEEIRIALMSDCKPFIDAVKWPYLRGSGSTITQMTKMKSFLGTKTGRYPKDLDQSKHDALNKEFDRKFGWKVRDGVFAGPEEAFWHIYYYGVQNYFFPIGKLKYAWSPQIEDLYYSIGSAEFSQTLINGVVSKYIDSEIEDNLTKEVAFKCKQYYLIPYNIKYRKILKEIIPQWKFRKI